MLERVSRHDLLERVSRHDLLERVRAMICLNVFAP